MAKFYTAKSIMKIKDNRFDFFGEFKEAFGDPTTSGLWLIYGSEKHGKTWFALLLADYLSKFKKTLYVSAEEGVDSDFRLAIKRARIQNYSSTLTFCDFIEIEQVETMVMRSRGPKIVIFDNVTVYQESLKGGVVQHLNEKYRGKVLFIFLAHEDTGEPYTAPAKLIKKYAKVIIRIEGLTAFISGRIPKATTMTIDEEKAMLYHGSQIKTQHDEKD